MKILQKAIFVCWLSLLNKHVKQANKAGTMSINTMRVSQKINSKYNGNGMLLIFE